MSAPRATSVAPIAINGGRTDDPRYPANSRKYPANQGLNAMNTVGEFTDTGSNNNPYRNAIDQNPNTMSPPVTAPSPKQDYTDALYGSGAGNGAGAGGGMGSGGYGTTTTTTETPAYKGDYDLSEYLRQQAAARIESELAGLSSAYQQSMRGYDRELKNIQQNYYNQRNQAAAQDAITRRNFDERAAASGLNSGTAGQADLARSAAYTGELARLGAAEENARLDVEMQKANAQTQYEQAIAEAKANNDQQLASALYQELIRVQGLERQDALNAAKAASSSVRYSSSGGGSGSGASSKTTEKPNLTAAQARDAIKSGIVNDTTIAAYEYWFGEAPNVDGDDGGAESSAKAAASNNPSTPPWLGEIANNSFKNPRNVDMYWVEGDVPKRATPDGRYVDAYSGYLSMDEIDSLWRQGIINRATNSKGQIVYSWAR